MRGLKLFIYEFIFVFDSRTLTGAWIETVRAKQQIPKVNVAPSRVRGLKQGRTWNKIRVESRSLTGAWIETDAADACVERNMSHPHGCVD